jgi:hypothetical protein
VSPGLDLRTGSRRTRLCWGDSEPNEPGIGFASAVTGFDWVQEVTRGIDFGRQTPHLRQAVDSGHVPAVERLHREAQRAFQQPVAFESMAGESYQLEYTGEPRRVLAVSNSPLQALHLERSHTRNGDEV